MKLFNWFRNWRIRRMEARIAYLERFCRFYSHEGNVTPSIDIYHGIGKKQAKLAELRKRVYHLMEF
jgi:hypothetical protein